MKFCLLANDFPPCSGGIETYFAGLLEALVPDDVLVIAPRVPGSRELDAGLAYAVERLRGLGPTLIPNASTVRKVAEVAASFRSEVVGVSSGWPLGLAIPSLRKLLRVPVIVWHHGAELAIPAAIPLLGSLLVRRLAVADVHLVVSEWTRDVTRRALGAKARIELLRYGVDVERFRPAESRTTREDERLRVLSLGRLVRRKGNDTLILAVAALVRRGVDLEVSIAGEGPDRRRLEGLVRETGVEGVVRFLGRVEDEQLAHVYQSHDVFVSPMRTRFGGLEAEGLGITLLEAQACGLPVVAGRSGGSAEAVVDGVTGYVVDGSDEMEVARALLRLAESAELRKRMGDEGRRLVVDRFSRRSMGAAFESVLAQCLGDEL